MKKVYFNKFYNKAVVIDEDARTYTLTSATTAQSMHHAGMGLYRVKMERIIEVFKQLKERGFKGYKKA